jgi:two-component system, cell cycle sensor histidine kinase and response regulator CckA
MSIKPTYEELEQQVQELKRAESRRKHAKEIQLEYKKRLILLAEQTRAYLWEVDADGLYIDLGPSVEELLGYRTEEIIGKMHFYELHPDDGREAFKTAAFEVFDRRDPFRGLCNRIETRTGEIIWVSTSGIPILDAEGSLTGYWGMDFDITDRKRAEDALRESEIKHKTLVKNIPGMIYRAFPDWSAEIVSGCKKISGYTSAELNSKEKSWLGITHPDDIERISNEGSLLASRPKDLVQTYRIITKGGKIRWVSDHKTSLFSKEGDFIGIDGIVFNITEQKQAEKDLRESEAQLHAILQSIQAAVMVHGPDTRVLKCNQASQELLGLTEDQMLGKKAIDPLWKFYDEDGGDMPPERYPVNRVMATKEILKDVIAGAYRPNKNDVVNILINAVPELDHAGNIFRVIVTFMDITERLRLEAHLRQAQKMESIGTLTGGIAHQFNNALAGITGNLDLLEIDFQDDKKVTRYAKAIRVSALRMAQLTTQLLAYARGGKYQTKTVSLSDFIKRTLPLVQSSIASAIRLGIDLPSDNLHVKVDLTQMQMVLSAVLANASEALDGKGRIRVTCKQVAIADDTTEGLSALKPGNYACLTVIDDGKGMDEKTKARIFEPFFTTKFDGRGLGMAAVYGIVKNHAGWISVDSEMGKGTTVRIYLPAVDMLVKEDVNKRPQAQWVKGSGTILVIDDEEGIAAVCRAMLERMGYRVLVARTGQEAVDIIKNYDSDIDLALLDILMPDMSGEIIYSLLMKARPGLKVIVCSGYSIDGPAQKILDAGAEDFMQKPFTMADLSEKLKKALRGKQ